MYKVLFTCIIYLLYVENDSRSERELKKMKRKITAIVLATAMCLSVLAGCGKKDEPANETNASQDSEVDLDALLDEAVDEHIEAAQAEAEANPEPDLPHYDCTDLVLNADPGDGYIQIADMVFQLGSVMTPDDVRKVVEGSSTGLQCVDATDDLGYKTVEVLDEYGNPVLGLEWGYYDPESISSGGNLYREDLTEVTNLLLGLVFMPGSSHDWVDYNSFYYAGGIVFPFANDMSYEADLSGFPYKTKDEYIAHLRSEGFLSKEELEAKEAETGVVDPLQGYYYEDDDTSKLSVFYPNKQTADKTVWSHKFTNYDFYWGLNGDNLSKISMYPTGRRDESKKPQ